LRRCPPRVFIAKRMNYKLLQTVLLVEDDLDDQELFTTALREIKNVTLLAIANNGKEAIDMLGRSLVLPSMIFMDINMPLMNGIECLRLIVSNPQINRIPVVVLSSESQYSHETRKLGAAGFIKKQITTSALRSEIEQILVELRSNYKSY
jgi:CheY-like chemotaxis protein